MTLAELEAREAARQARDSRRLIVAAVEARRARDEAEVAYHAALVAAYHGRGARTVAEVAEELGVSRPYLYRLAARAD